MRTLELECLSRTVKICFRRYQNLNFVSVMFVFSRPVTVSKKRRDVVTHACIV